MIHSFDKINGNVVADNERYLLVDNTDLRNLVLSKTSLHADQATRGHSHPGQEEVYFFVSGYGTMVVGEETFAVQAGSVITIPDGAFHRVINQGRTDLEFICVFDGNRNH